MTLRILKKKNLLAFNIFDLISYSIRIQCQCRRNHCGMQRTLTNWNEIYLWLMTNSLDPLNISIKQQSIFQWHFNTLTWMNGNPCCTFTVGSLWWVFLSHIYSELCSKQELKSFLLKRWNDEKLKWNKSDYGNISVLHVGVHEIWQPDILLYNSAAGGNLDYLGNTNLVVHDTGKVLWVPPAHLQVFCDIDLHHWPYDTHECYLKFGSWTLSNAEIELSIDEKLVVDMDRLVKNSEWEVQTYSGERRLTLYQSVDEAYVDVTINLTLSRRSPMYRTVVTVPAIVIILLTLGSFWLPADHGERILLNGINAVIIVMFLVYFAEKLNVMAMHTPLIGEHKID